MTFAARPSPSRCDKHATDAIDSAPLQTPRDIDMTLRNPYDVLDGGQRLCGMGYKERGGAFLPHLSRPS